MSNHICKLLEKAVPDTAVKKLKVNGKDVSGVREFVKYDKATGLAFFTNESGSTFAAICEKIDIIELEGYC